MIPQETLEQITTHLVFPRNLPSGCHEHGSMLVQLVLDAMRAAANDNFQLPLTSIKLLQRFQKLMPLIDSNAISTELQQLNPGEMLGMYVRKQNSCLIVYHLPATDEYIVSTFPVLLTKNQLYDCDSDAQVKLNFGYVCNEINFFRCLPG